MKKILLSSILALSVIASANSQAVYKEGFTTGSTTPTNSAYFAPVTGYTATRTTSGTNSNICTITKTASAGQYASMAYEFYTNPQQYQTPPSPKTQITTIDISGTAPKKDTIFVIARSTVAGTKLRIDLKDSFGISAGTVQGFDSDFNCTNELALTTAFAVYKYLYEAPQDKYSTCGGGSPPAACPNAPLNKAKINILLFSLNNGATPVTAADADIDYLQIGGSSTGIVLNAAGGGGDPAFVVGGGGTTAVSAAQANISSSKLYPNPTSDMANISLELKSSSDVKVTLTDLMGKEIMTIANGNMASLNESFSVANLHKGIYTVNYFINGSAAKAEMLMVK
jgi:hypothetical protein